MKPAFYKYIAALLMFGLNGIVASHIALTSYEIVFTRTLIGSMLLALIFLATRQKAHLLENKAHLLYLVISGAAMGASWMFLYEAYRQIGVSIATLAYYCGPVIVMVLSPLLYKEKFTWAKALGFIVVLAGMVCINIQVLSEGKTTWGLFYGIMAAVMYAFMVIFNKKARSMVGLENPMWQLMISFLTVAIFLVIKQGLILQIEPGSLLPILVLGIVNTGIGCYFYFSSIGDLPAQTVAIFGYLEPLSAVIFSAIFLSETLGPARILGAVMILGGAAFAELFSAKKLPNR